jgi:chitinase
MSSAVSATTQPAAQLAISLTSPAANATLTRGSTVALRVSVGGVPARVQYRLDDAVIATLTASPWSYTWLVPSSTAAGWHSLDAVAAGSDGSSATSQQVKVKIN